MIILLSIQYRSECPPCQTHWHIHVYHERHWNNYIQLYTFLLLSENCLRMFQKLGIVLSEYICIEKHLNDRTNPLSIFNFAIQYKMYQYCVTFILSYFVLICHVKLLYLILAKNEALCSV